MTVDGTEQTLSTDQAAALRSQLGEVLARKQTFVRTALSRREDGSYRIVRRNADSTGNSTVFEDFGEIRQAYDQLPETFTAAGVEQLGETGSRRHLLVHFYAEHPAFDCTITSRCPLTARKRKNQAGIPAKQEGNR